MRIIALMNQKGGVGKTTTCANLAAALAEQGKKVCMIDLDPQAHLTINYGLNPSPELTSLYQVLVDGHGLLAALQQVGQNLALVPGSIDLAAAEVELVNVPGRQTLLKSRLEAAGLEFDFILMDCPPSLGLLTVNALAVAQEVIIPMQPHFLALQGVGKLLETVALVSQRVNPVLKVSGIVLTMFDSQTKLCNEVVNDLNGFIKDAIGKNLPGRARGFSPAGFAATSSSPKAPVSARRFCNTIPPATAPTITGHWREVLEMTAPPAVAVSISPAAKSPKAAAMAG